MAGSRSDTAVTKVRFFPVLPRMYDVIGKRAALKMQILQVRIPLYPQVLLLMCVNMKICTGGEMVNTAALGAVR